MNTLHPPFIPFNKIPRICREKIILTEKIDGTNAVVHVDLYGKVFAGSRSRWLSPDNDNYGFATWVKAYEAELCNLGPGYHYGEWWGHGINRNYGLRERRFSLFNVYKWGDRHSGQKALSETGSLAPVCCHVVPLLHVQVPPLTELWRSFFWCKSPFDRVISRLRCTGSRAVPGFMQPEGIVLFGLESQRAWKWTFQNPEGKHVNS